MTNDITTATTLKAGCYMVPNPISVDAALTLEPGVSMILAQSSYIDVGYSGTAGSLHAVGTAANPITFKGSGTPGSWDSLYFYSSQPANRLSYVTVSGGGNGTAKQDVYVGGSAQVTIDHSTIENSKKYGIYVVSGGSLILGGSNTYTGNGSITSVYYAP